MSEKTRPKNYQIAFGLLLVFGIFFRLYFALSRTDLVWPDEHFQTLEPAGWVVWGFGLKAWEWLRGFRSWLGPAPFIPLFFILKLFGISGGATAIYTARTAVAIFSGFSLFRFDRFLKNENFSELSHFFALAFYTLSPALMLWGVTTLTDHLALCAFTLFLPSIYLNYKNKPARAGLCFGFLFLVRFQTIAFIPGYVLFLAFSRTLTFKSFLQGASRFCGCVLFFGLVDWITWGLPFHSIYKQLTEGLKISEFYGKENFDFYLTALPGNIGGMFSVLLLAAIAIGAFNKKRRSLFLLTLLPSLSFFLIHSLLAHKEVRFLLPIYLSIPVLYAVALELLPVKMPAVIYTLAVFPMAFFSYHLTQQSVLYLTPVNIFDLEAAIRTDGLLLKPNAHRCVLSIGHNWSWSRGQLMQATEFEFKEMDIANYSFAPDYICPYALVHTNNTVAFTEKTLTNSDQWQFMQKAQTSPFVLYRRIHPTK